MFLLKPGKLRIEQRGRQAANGAARRPDLHDVVRPGLKGAVVEVRANDPGRYVEIGKGRKQHPGVIFEAAAIGRFRRADEAGNSSTAARALHEAVFQHDAIIRPGRRRRHGRSRIAGAFHLPKDHSGNRLEDLGPLCGHRVGWVTDNLAGKVAVAARRIQNQNAAKLAGVLVPEIIGPSVVCMAAFFDRNVGR